MSGNDAGTATLTHARSKEKPLYYPFCFILDNKSIKKTARTVRKWMNRSTRFALLQQDHEAHNHAFFIPPKKCFLLLMVHNVNVNISVNVTAVEPGQRLQSLSSESDIAMFGYHMDHALSTCNTSFETLKISPQLSTSTSDIRQVGMSSNYKWSTGDIVVCQIDTRFCNAGCIVEVTHNPPPLVIFPTLYVPSLSSTISTSTTQQPPPLVLPLHKHAQAWHP